MPQFDYCSTIWVKEKGKEMNKLLKIQKRAARIILHQPVKTASAPLFKELQWLTFNHRYIYNLAVLIYKALNDLTPPYVKELLVVSNNRSYFLRSNVHKDIQTLRARTKYFKNTFTYTSRDIWNTIPLTIRNSSSLNVFKTNFKKYLLNLQN